MNHQRVGAWLQSNLRKGNRQGEHSRSETSWSSVYNQMDLYTTSKLFWLLEYVPLSCLRETFEFNDHFWSRFPLFSSLGRPALNCKTPHNWVAVLPQYIHLGFWFNVFWTTLLCYAYPTFVCVILIDGFQFGSRPGRCASPELPLGSLLVKLCPGNTTCDGGFAITATTSYPTKEIWSIVNVPLVLLCLW